MNELKKHLDIQSGIRTIPKEGRMLKVDEISIEMEES
jgi:hypothetical protein